MAEAKSNQAAINEKEILAMDARTLAKKIASQEFTSAFVTSVFIKHIKKVNEALNCLVEDRFEQAMQEAERADEEIRKNGAGNKKLLGVPISMKESFDVAEMKTTGGLMHRKNAVSQRDADVVAALKTEGSIILGKTNTPTLCFCQETVNKLYGRTNNPWDLSRTPGGSSGGEGA